MTRHESTRGGPCADVRLCAGSRPATVASICTGVAGLDRAVHRVIRGIVPVVYVENDITNVVVLASHMEAGRLPEAPVWSDLDTFDGRPLWGRVGLLVGGIPCQPYSGAGRQAGADDHRDLWPQTTRILGEMQPPLVFIENVAGIIGHPDGLRRIGEKLQALGYRFACAVVKASDAGAPHRRARLFVLGWRPDLAHPGRGTLQSGGKPGRLAYTERASPGAGRIGATGDRGAGSDADTLGDSYGTGPQGRCVCGCERSGEWPTGSSIGPIDDPVPFWPYGPDEIDAWRSIVGTDPWLAPATPESVVYGLADVRPEWHRLDVPGCNCSRTDRLRQDGNAVVPDQAEIALRYLWHEAFGRPTCPCVVCVHD